MRKINTILVTLIIIMLGKHGITSALYFLGIIDYSSNFIMTGRRLFIVVGVHILVSSALYLKDKLNRRGLRFYKELSKPTIVQMITGMLIFLFMLFHWGSYAKVSAKQVPDVFSVALKHWSVDVIFISSIMLHLYVSIPRWIISLGLVKERKHFQKAKKCITIILAIAWSGFMLGEILFYII